MQSTPITSSLSKIASTLPASTPIQVRGGLASIGGHALPEKDALMLAALASQQPGLTLGRIADLLMTGVYHRLVMHTRRTGAMTPAGPITTHTIGLRSADGASIPLSRLWAEVTNVHQARMKSHGTKKPVRILDIQGRLVAQLADGKRFPVSNLVRSRLAIGGTYPAYIHTFTANNRPMHIAVPQPEHEVRVEVTERVNLPRPLAVQVKNRAEELHLQGQIMTLQTGGAIQLGNFALQN
jgi:hypothetical protein